MQTSFSKRHLFRFVAQKTAIFLGILASASHAQTFQLTPISPSGTFAPGQPIGWKVSVEGDAALLKNPRFKIKRFGQETIAEGTLDLAQTELRIETQPLDSPATLLLELVADGPDAKQVKALGGAVVEAGKITPIVTRPDDFDEFWKNQIAALNAVPANVQIEAGESGRADVDYFKVTFDNVDGAKISAQMARPKVGTKFPGVVVTQWAGVYGLQKGWVTNRASQGFLVINVLAHDLPIDESADFYRAQDAGALKGYPSLGNESRETSYFRRMFLGNVRAADYLASRADWDEKTLVASGGSQGGYQSIVLAGLDSRVTAVLASVPAGCDITARSANRASGWPGWWLPSAPETRAAVIETARYFDAINFASRVRAPVLVGLGLIDATCPPGGVFAMINQLQGPKETIIMPLRGHTGGHPPYEARAGEWWKSLAAGQTPPPTP